MELLKSLADWIEFATIGAVMLCCAVAIFRRNGFAELRLEAMCASRNAGLGIAFAVVSLFAGFLLNQFGSWYISPAHLYIMQKAEAFNSSLDKKEPPSGSREEKAWPLDPDFEFLKKPLFRLDAPSRGELQAYRREEARQIVWAVCDPETMERYLPGGAGLKAMRIVRGTIGGVVVLLPLTVVLVLLRCISIASRFLKRFANKKFVSIAGLDLEVGRIGFFNALGWTIFLLLLYSCTMCAYWYWEFDLHMSFGVELAMEEPIDVIFSKGKSDAWQCPPGLLEAVNARHSEISKKGEPGSTSDKAPKSPGSKGN